MSYTNEPFILQVLEKYPDEFDPESINEYYKTKINLRNGKDIANSSKVNQISVLKKFLKDIKDIPELSLLKLPDTITKPVKVDQVKQRDLHHTNQMIVKDSNTLIQNTLQGLNSKLFSDLYPALLLASGRRPTELYMMKFRKGIKDNEITFNAQLKKRGNADKYTVPLLVNTILFRKALRNFQRLFPEVAGNNMTPDEIAKKYSKRNADTLLYFSSQNGIKLKASDFRRIYVAESYRRSENTERSFNSWIKEFLGHDSLEVSLNYSTVILE
jgi:hypothetical protein